MFNHKFGIHSAKKYIDFSRNYNVKIKYSQTEDAVVLANIEVLDVNIFPKVELIEPFTKENYPNIKVKCLGYDLFIEIKSKHEDYYLGVLHKKGV